MAIKMIKTLVMDVDGTLTDGKIYMGAMGEAYKVFHVKDGYAIKNILPKCGMIPMILTGRKSEILLQRCKELDIVDIIQGSGNKEKDLDEILKQKNILWEEVAYIGDDLNDLECMKKAAVSGCPADAAGELLAIATYICSRKGGEGAVREFVEYLAKSTNNKDICQNGKDDENINCNVDNI